MALLLLLLLLLSGLLPGHPVGNILTGYKAGLAQCIHPLRWEQLAVVCAVTVAIRRSQHVQNGTGADGCESVDVATCMAGNSTTPCQGQETQRQLRMACSSTSCVHQTPTSHHLYRLGPACSSSLAGWPTLSIQPGPGYRPVSQHYHNPTCRQTVAAQKDHTRT